MLHGEVDFFVSYGIGWQLTHPMVLEPNDSLINFSDLLCSKEIADP